MDKRFAPDIIAAAQASQHKWRVPASISLAQWALESAYGKSMPASSNNPFGIKAKPGEPFVSAMTWERLGGKDIRLEQRFRKFASLDVYTRAFRRTGFQGALNWFRCHTGPIGRTEIELFSGKAIEVPALFTSGVADWGTYRKPGALDRMRSTTCPRMTAVELIEGAGHWVQQEQPESFNATLISFLQKVGSEGRP